MERQKLTLKQLECLLAVKQTRHFRKAAELLDVQQPTITTQIQNLEEILGVQVLERSRSGVSVTPAGREIATYAQEVMTTLQDITDYASSAKTELAGTIRLGTTPTVGPYFLPFVVRQLHKTNKGLKLYVRESGARDLEHELSQGAHDLILTQISSASRDLEYQSIFHEPLYLVVAVDHPLAKKQAVTLQDIAGLNILSLSPSYHLHDQVSRLCEEFDAYLSREYEGTSLDALRQMVGMGMGETFLPALYIHSEIRARSEVAVKKIKGRNLTRNIGLVWRRKSGHDVAYQKITQTMKAIAAAKFADLIVLQKK